MRQPTPAAVGLRTNPETTQALLAAFVGRAQLTVLVQSCRGEEGAWFKTKLAQLVALFGAMPQIYAQGDLGQDAIVHLHYFKNGCDWYITERDTSTAQHQAFGAADLGHGAELGYISIAEAVANGAELDLHWEPKTLRQALDKADVH